MSESEPTTALDSSCAETLLPTVAVQDWAAVINGTNEVFTVIFVAVGELTVGVPVTLKIKLPDPYSSFPPCNTKFKPLAVNVLPAL